VTMTDRWHLIHDFVRGWGYRECDPASPIAREIMLDDVERHFPDLLDGEHTDDGLDLIYRMLRPYILARDEEVRKHIASLGKIEFRTMTMPRITRLGSLPDIRSLFDDMPPIFPG